MRKEDYAKLTEEQKEEYRAKLRSSERKAKLQAWRKRTRIGIARRREIRKQVIEHYGSRCFCCGETEIEFLTIDHVNGGGHKHKSQVGKGLRFLQWIIKNDYPSDLQILCWNCNCARGAYGYCPHKAKQPVTEE